jgi:hypothetical protein
MCGHVLTYFDLDDGALYALEVELGYSYNNRFPYFGEYPVLVSWKVHLDLGHNESPIP